MMDPIHNMETELHYLQEDISKEMVVVLESLQRRHVDCVPVLKKEKTRIAESLDAMHSSLGERLNEIEKGIEEQDVKAALKELTRLRENAGKLRACRGLLDNFSSIENTLATLDIEFGKNVKTDAQNIVAALKLIASKDELSTADEEAMTTRINAILANKLEYATNLLSGRLHSWFKKVFVFPPSRTAHITELHVKMNDAYEMINHFEAMCTLDVLDGWLQQVASYLMSNLAGPILAGGGAALIDCAIDNVDEGLYIFRVKARKSSKALESREIQPDVVFDQLLTLFKHLRSSLIQVIVNGRPLSSTIVHIITQELQMAVLKRVITPLSADESRLEKTMEEAEKFRQNMIELEHFNDVTPTFAAFAELNERVFVDRKCISLLVKARELVQMEYVDLKTVGTDADETGNESAQFDEDCRRAMGMTPSQIASAGDESHPHFFRLIKCSVSTSMVELVQLLRTTVMEAARAENEATSARLMLTARNIAQLFLTLAPKHHKTALSSVPLIAAVYYNNCNYLGHHLMLLVFDIVGMIETKTSYRDFLADFLLQLRQSARDVMEMQLAQVRRNISTLLQDTKMFDASISGNDKPVTACRMQITSLSSVWKEVLAEVPYCRALGNIVGFFLGELTRLLLQVEDLRTVDAVHSAELLRSALEPIEKLFVIRGTPMLHKECTKAYFHYKEILFVLNASLQDIDDRWCDGKGPLAEYMSTAEIRHLIRALFSNTEQRKRMLDKIY